MKSRKVRGLISVFFALAMALSTGALLSKARANKEPEIVLAEGEEQAPEQSSEETPEQSSEETPEQSSEETPAEQPSEGGGEAAPEEQADSSAELTPKNIFMVFANAFRDAIKDLIRHIKRWFGR